MNKATDACRILQVDQEILSLNTNFGTNFGTIFSNLAFRTSNQLLSVMAAITNTDFRDALQRIFFDVDAQNAIVEQGVESIRHLVLLGADGIKTICKICRDSETNIPFMQQHYLEAMRFWGKDRLRLGLPVDAALFTLAQAEDAALRMVQEAEEIASKDAVKPTVPDKFSKPTGWLVFKETLLAYLGQLKGVNRIPLVYVVRVDNAFPPGTLPDTERERRIALVPLVGTDYRTDNETVFAIIKELTLQGPGWNWIEFLDRRRDGRACFQALMAHYEGDSMLSRAKEQAYSDIASARYTGLVKAHTFEMYITTHQKAHSTLQRHGEPVPPMKQVRDFLAGITSSNLVQAVNTCYADPAKLVSFTLASNFLSQIHDNTEIRNSAQRRVAVVNLAPERSGPGRAHHPGRSGRGRGGRGHGRSGSNGGRSITRHYTPAQWAELGTDGMNAVKAARAAKKRSYSQVSATSSVPSSGQLPPPPSVKALPTPQGLPPDVHAGDQFGRHGQNRSISLAPVHTSTRRIAPRAIALIKQVSAPTLPKDARTELDSHADTCCAGSSSRVVEYTGKTCHVSPFSADYDAIPDVPIAKTATAYDNSLTGETYILILAQSLYFGDALEHTLLCPNQLRSHGVVVDDVPVHLSPSPSTATHSIFFPDENIRLPLKMQGCISYLPTRYPTDEELHNCQWLIMTGDLEWDPHSPNFASQEEIALTTAHTVANETLDRSIKALHTCAISSVLAAVSTSLVDDTLLRDLEDSVQVRDVHAVQSTNRKSHISKEDLARRWGLGVETAARTLVVTTQKGIRNAVHPLHRRYRTNQQQLRYNQLASLFYSDTMFSKTKSSRGYTMGQVFVNDIEYTRFIPMKSKADAGDALSAFIQDVGIPSGLHTDDARELTQKHWATIRNRYGIRQTLTEPHSPWQNRAEGTIRELKKAIARLMKRHSAPKRLWDFAAAYAADIRSLTAHPLFSLEGRTPYEKVTGNTPDISEWVEFDWYEPLWYYEADGFPSDKRLLGRWLGVAHRIGQAMCYWILPASGVAIARTTVQKISPDEMATDTVRAALQQYNQGIRDTIGDSVADDNAPPPALGLVPQAHFLQDEDVDDDFTPFEPAATMPEADEYDADAYDAYISANVLLPKGDGYVGGRVISRKRDGDGHPVGIRNQNPLLDTRVYNVEFPDGHVSEYAANVIAESVYSQVDEEGREYAILAEIMGHKSDGHAVLPADMWIEGNGSRNRHMRRTTKGWKLCVSWKDGTTSWEPLCNLKESNPVQVAEYAVTNNIADAPAFAWWVKDVLRRRARIINAVRSRYLKRTHKFGIQVPKTLTEALQLDRDTNTDFWHQALLKEMKNVMAAFEFHPIGSKAPVGYKWIPLHLIFDVKMDFTRKVRLVAGGHVTDPPTSMTYSSVVSRESVRIAFLIAALNDLDVLAADIGNAYLNATTRERVYTTAGKEFGSREGETVLIVRALYGLKSSGAAWRAHLAQSLRDLGYTPSYADPDVYYRAATKPDGFEYYEYLLVYVDDILCISHKPQETMVAIGKLYRLKDDTIAEPTVYLGATIKKHRFHTDPSKVRWGMSSDKYLGNAISNVELELAKIDKKLSTKASTPLACGYRPELDVSPLLDAERANYFQNLIGILRWAVELGRVDIHIGVALLSSYLVQPRTGHLEQAFHVFAYLKSHQRSTMVFDDTRAVIPDSRFHKCDWTDFYPEAREPIPPNAIAARGNSVQMNAFVDADHAGDRLTRRSHTGILIFLNKAPIVWFSKRQNTVETSTFGSEFVAMKICTEIIEGLRYKLRMFGIPIDGPANVFCDNEAVVKNATVPESTLKKKHNAIAYHRVREALAAGTIRITKEHTSTNVADILTKLLPNPTLKLLCERILY